MSTITPNADQAEALDKANRWMDAPLSNCFSLGGLAGTGKSTLIPLILDSAKSKGLKTRIATPTGKAAAVVNAKLGLDIASTIHSMAYTFLGERRTNRRDFLDRELSEPVFQETGFCSDLIIIDEASMVDERTYNHLVSNSALFLFIGDHGQLTPINEGVSLALKNLDHELTTIVRQAEGSPIIETAYNVRGGCDYRNGLAKGVDVFGYTNPNDIADRFVEDKCDMVICATNKMRDWLNTAIRSRLGLSDSGKHFGPGDRLLTTSNMHTMKVYNGSVFKVLDCVVVDETREGPIIEADLFDEVTERELYSVPIGYRWRSNKAIREGIVSGELGYALTAHKAQGSQGDRVIVVDEYLGWMKEHAPRHRYTSVTRAAKELLIARFDG